MGYCAQTSKLLCICRPVSCATEVRVPVTVAAARAATSITCSLRVLVQTDTSCTLLADVLKYVPECTLMSLIHGTWYTAEAINYVATPQGSLHAHCVNGMLDLDHPTMFRLGYSCVALTMFWPDAHQCMRCPPSSLLDCQDLLLTPRGCRTPCWLARLHLQGKQVTCDGGHKLPQSQSSTVSCSA